MGGWSQAVEGTAVAQLGLVCSGSKQASPKRMWHLYGSTYFVASFV